MLYEGIKHEKNVINVTPEILDYEIEDFLRKAGRNFSESSLGSMFAVYPPLKEAYREEFISRISQINLTSQKAGHFAYMLTLSAIFGKAEYLSIYLKKKFRDHYRLSGKIAILAEYKKHFDFDKYLAHPVFPHARYSTRSCAQMRNKIFNSSPFADVYV